MPTDSLRARLGELEWPTPLRDHPEPAPGQLWRASWGRVIGLVVVTSAPDGRSVDVIAASHEDKGDDLAVRIDTRTGMTLTAWCGISGSIMTFTLDYRIGDLTTWSTDLIASTPVNGGDWPPIFDTEDDRAVERAELLDELEELHTAEWLAPASGTGETVAQVMEREGLSSIDVAGRLGIPPGRAYAIIRGETPTTPEEDALLSDLLGSDTSTGFVVDEDLLPELDSPVFRPRLASLANRRFGGDWQQARLSAAGSAMAMAARHREPGARNWRGILEEVLRED